MQLTSTDGAVFELCPSGYEYPDFTTAGEPDANWLMLHGRVRTAAGESWTFEGPDLSTWEAKELLDWLNAAAEGRLEPTDIPGLSLVTSTLMFIEPNLAFSIAAVESEHTVLRVHLSLEAAAAKPGWTGGAQSPHLRVQHPVTGRSNPAAHGGGTVEPRHCAVPSSLTTGKPALHDGGCNRGLNPPASSRDRAM